MDNFYSKYIKYKTKYYNLKRGGAVAKDNLSERIILINTFKKNQVFFNQYLDYVKKNDPNKNDYCG